MSSFTQLELLRQRAQNKTIFSSSRGSATKLALINVVGLLQLESGVEEKLVGVLFGHGAVVVNNLSVVAGGLDAALLLELEVVRTAEGSEAPLGRDKDLLAACELVLGTAEGFLRLADVIVLCADGHEDLADANASSSAVGLAKGAAHARLEAVGASAGEHLVDAKHLEGVDADAKVEGLFAGGADHVLVGSNTSSFKRLTGDLLLLEGDEMNAAGEDVDVEFPHATVVNADLRVRNASAIPALLVRLVLALPALAQRKENFVGRNRCVREGQWQKTQTDWSLHKGECDARC